MKKHDIREKECERRGEQRWREWDSCHRRFLLGPHLFHILHNSKHKCGAHLWSTDKNMDKPSLWKYVFGTFSLCVHLKKIGIDNHSLLAHKELHTKYGILNGLT